jgi:hypothetical protein
MQVLQRANRHYLETEMALKDSMAKPGAWSEQVYNSKTPAAQAELRVRYSTQVQHNGLTGPSRIAASQSVQEGRFHECRVLFTVHTSARAGGNSSRNGKPQNFRCKISSRLHPHLSSLPPAGPPRSPPHPSFLPPSLPVLTCQKMCLGRIGQRRQCG